MQINPSHSFGLWKTINRGLPLIFKGLKSWCKGILQQWRATLHDLWVFLLSFLIMCAWFYFPISLVCSFLNGYYDGVCCYII